MPSMLTREAAHMWLQFDRPVGVAQFHAARETRLQVKASRIVELVVLLVVGRRQSVRFS